MLNIDLGLKNDHLKPKYLNTLVFLISIFIYQIYVHHNIIYIYTNKGKNWQQFSSQSERYVYLAFVY